MIKNRVICKKFNISWYLIW